MADHEELEIPDQLPDYSSPEYWDDRYTTEPEASYDWLISYSQLRPIIIPRLHDNYDAEILVVGCGNSSLSEDLYKDGYKNITNIDFSSTVIAQMGDKYKMYEEMDFSVMDACNLQYPQGCFSVVIDKGTLDCVLCGEQSFQRANAMLQGVYRALQPGGVYILVSYGMPDTRIGYLKSKYLTWTVEQAKLSKMRLEHFANYEVSQYHYIYICTKQGDA